LLPDCCVWQGIARAENPPGIPAEYKLLHSQDFAKPEAIKDFQFSDPGAMENQDERW
jgi:hypothetical protein